MEAPKSNRELVHLAWGKVFQFPSAITWILPGLHSSQENQYEVVILSSGDVWRIYPDGTSHPGGS